MKKRAIKARVREVMKYKMPTCFFNGVTSNFMTKFPHECSRLYDLSMWRIFEEDFKDLIASVIRNGQKMLPRTAKDWSRRTTGRRKRYGQHS